MADDKIIRLQKEEEKRKNIRLNMLQENKTK